MAPTRITREIRKFVEKNASIVSDADKAELNSLLDAFDAHVKVVQEVFEIGRQYHAQNAKALTVT
jgi:hypothetical protein